MIFSRNNKRLDPRRRFGTREFQAKIKRQQTYRRVRKPIDLTRKSKWLVILGFRSKAYRVMWITLILAAVYLFVFSDYMVIGQVTVTGTSKIDPNQIQSIVSSLGSQRTFLIPKANFFLLTRSRLASSIRQVQPFVKDVVKYHRTWPNKATIEISERDPGFILQSGEKQFLIDDEGVVVTDDPNSAQLPIVQDQVTENFDTGTVLNNTKLVAFILSMQKQWPDKIASQIKETKIPGQAANEVQFVSEEGWGVFFDTTRSVSSQLNNLALILSREIPAKNRLNLAYIDLRLSKWAYYCYKDAPCVAGAAIDVLNPDGTPADPNTPSSSAATSTSTVAAPTTAQSKTTSALTTTKK
jgi:cell division septal protein FtsQ